MNSNITAIQKNVYGGYGLAYHEGKTVFIPYTLPGDTVSFTPYKQGKNTVFASIDTILEPSQKRVSPPCPNFAVCGGCSYQHCVYQDELVIKKSHLYESLSRIGGIQFTDEIPVISAKRYHYRSTAGIQYSGSGHGFYRAHSHDVVPFPEKGCLLLQKEITDFLSGTKVLPKKSFRVSADRTGSCVIKPSGIVRDEINGTTFTRKNSSFFQANRYLRPLMINEVLKMLQPDRSDTVIDAGCGAGFFSIPLSRYVKRVLAFDSDKNAVNSVKENASLNSITNIHCAAVPFHAYSIKNADSMIVDPPRSGLPKEFITAIQNSSIQKIVYVSCDPSSWARDIGRLQGKFGLKRAAFIDMFPATYHIEVISLLERV